jgi:hypothetical protein
MIISSFHFGIFSMQIYTTTCESMKAVPVLVCVLLVIITSSAASPGRKLAGADGQQTDEGQTKMSTIDGRPGTGYGNHSCSIGRYPSCSKRLEKVASNRRG